MADLFTTVVNFLTTGGSVAVIALLVIIVSVLILDRRHLAKNITETTKLVYEAKDSETKSIKEIVDRYHQGHVDLVQALNEIKIVLVAIQTTRR